MQAIFAAFDRNGIACRDIPVQDSGCDGTPSDPNNVPVLSGTAGSNQAALQWTPVDGAVAYQVFRTEGLRGCDMGKVLLTTTTDLSYRDMGLMNERDYFYVVIPKGSMDESSSCFGHSSQCLTMTPSQESLSPSFSSVPTTSSAPSNVASTRPSGQPSASPTAFVSL